jgi:hypothetical protein
MFSLTFFTEILVVGILLLLGLSPIGLILLKILKVEVRIDIVHKLEERSALIFVVLAVAYALGVLGNRLIDQILPDDGDRTSQHRIMSLVQARMSLKEVSSVNITCVPGEDSDADCLKVVVAALTEHNASIGGWFERHKSYIRVERAAAISFGLFALCVGVYWVAEKYNQSLTKGRYRAWHAGLALFLGMLFFLGYWYENRSYGKAAFLLYKRLPPAVVGKS